MNDKGCLGNPPFRVFEYDIISTISLFVKDADVLVFLLETQDKLNDYKNDSNYFLN